MKNIKIAVRIDDFCADIDKNKFLIVTNFLDKMEIKPLIGIIPENKDKTLKKGDCFENFWEVARDLQNKGYTFAQHGFNHVYTSKDGGILNINKRGEHTGEDVESQYRILSEGRKILQKNGFDLNIYMAPSNSFDKNTLKALKKLNFKYVTDGWTNYLYEMEDLVFIPCRNVIKISKHDSGIITLMLHTNTLTNKQFEIFKQTIINNRENVVNYDELLNCEVKKHNKFKEKFLIFITKFKRFLSGIKHKILGE